MTVPTAEEQLKRRAAERAAEWIPDNAALGLGTGSTVRHLLEVIAERRSRGELRSLVGVPTSEATAARARELGIPIGSLDQHPVLALTIDGADEVGPELDLIKGLGGALLREKIVATASRELLIIADASKRVERLGTRAPLPVEVDPFGAAIQRPFLEGLGAEVHLRLAGDGRPYTTDGGNHILDCRFPDGIADAVELEEQLNRRTGVIESGLFLGMANRVIVAGADGIEIMTRRSGGG